MKWLVSSVSDAENDDSSVSQSSVSATESTAFQELLARVASPPAPSTLPQGAVVGEYRIERELGRGAFGAVYHATHTVIGKQVALKVLGAQFSEDPAMAARFIDEARAVNRIAHPNIVDIFGFGVLPDGRKYCVMELLRGSTLAEHLKQHGPLPAPEALEILSQMAQALDAAHENGIVHRDLKPENVFLVRSSAGDASAPHVKLLDFGIAQIADGLHQRTGSNMVLGTPAYMSPEQCRGARIDFRSDVYSLGVLAFELFSGSLPFRGVNAFQLTAQHLTAEPPRPSEFHPQLPAAFDAAVLELLAKSADLRPASASAAVALLARAFDASARTAGSAVSQRVPSPAKSRRWSWWLGGAAALAIGLLLLIAWRRHPAAEKIVPDRARALPEPAPVAVPLAPAPAASVTLRVSGGPPSASVFHDGRELSRLGEPFRVARSGEALSLIVKAPGYADRELRVVPEADQELSAKLKHLAGPKPHAELEY